MKVAADHVVQIEYTLTNAEGDVLDQSNGQPLAYLHGHHNLIPGLEAELADKEVGAKFNATIAAAEAYGEIEPMLIQQVPRDLFEGVDNIEVGMRFEAQSDQGMQSVVIKAIDGDMIMVDANHPLAGQDLTFDIEIMNIRTATAEELDHGHAHGDGGVQH
ncbi:peptidylprolyl isomerase [Thiomicrospira sp. ALE5]|uniref:FKBP-type peptidyl-prolyl cis-trans isomerase n=1 Tax=Thiomicrospira sp. ALE5 TaxID=748650 RepID=UPI0008EEBA5C|nr:peptidylprolyl isomerase [Thiomicrospira sp. ALE5]SFR50918.1 FKBP-type peptidyl-prolyl cis-trans isomerase SlyD [Thiomicrospira sp. ALE5]